MLTEVCDFVHNYFEYAIHDGTFEISDGTINLDSLVANGQRFRIIGSALNDGIYTYHADGIKDDDDDEIVTLRTESFDGTVVAMAVPKQVLDLVDEISAWIMKNKDVLESPFASESFGGYSYTKASASGRGAGLLSSGELLTWRSVFGNRLTAYRKIG